MLRTLFDASLGRIVGIGDAPLENLTTKCFIPNFRFSFGIPAGSLTMQGKQKGQMTNDGRFAATCPSF
jgi:hypothetical protein